MVDFGFLDDCVLRSYGVYVVILRMLDACLGILTALNFACIEPILHTLEVEKGVWMTSTERNSGTDGVLRAIATEFSDPQRTSQGDEIALAGCQMLLQPEGSDTAFLAEADSISRSGVVVHTRSPVSVDTVLTARWVGTRTAVSPIRLRVVSAAESDRDGWVARLTLV